jgi:hypothetical protein
MRILLAAIVVFIGIPGAAYPDNWPQWRGASGNGVSSETGVPSRSAKPCGPSYLRSSEKRRLDSQRRFNLRLLLSVLRDVVPRELGQVGSFP